MKPTGRQRQMQQAVPVAWLALAAAYWVGYAISGRAFTLIAAISWTVLGSAMLLLNRHGLLKRRTVGVEQNERPAGQGKSPIDR